MHAPAEPADTDAKLTAELRRIRLVARVAAGLWIIAAVVATIGISNRVLTAYVNDAAAAAERDATAIAGIVNRMFHELSTIPRVLSSNQQLRAIAERYDARGAAFAALSPEARQRELVVDPAVAAANRRLTLIRNNLGYDLLYLMDSRGIRIVSSDWDAPVSLLGIRLDDRDYYKDAMADRDGQMFAVARTTHNPVLFFSAAVDSDHGPIGVVVVRQDSDALGAALAGGRHIAMIVDTAGMVVASSSTELTLHHVGVLATARPDPTALREIYAQDALRTLDIRRPAHAGHADEWLYNGHPYVIKRASLVTPRYGLLLLSPIDRLEAVRPLHYALGVLAALFGIVAALLVQRRAEGLARRRDTLRITGQLNERLKASNVAKDRYLGIAAHDLRNPLSSMRGLAEVMLETPLDAEQQREFLGTIRRTADEMLGLVNDLLDISVIESGKLELRRSDIDVVKLVRQRLRHLEPHALSKQMTITLDSPDRLGARIDAARFAQVVDNLASNAIKFSPAGTTVDLTLRQEGDGFVFVARDHGPGIPEQDRALLFRSFQKLSARPTAGEKSTGLGLAIIKNIVDAHGGRIEVDSAPGGGARFTVTMPSTMTEG